MTWTTPTNIERDGPTGGAGGAAPGAVVAPAYTRLTDPVLLGTLSDPIGYLSGATGLAGNQLTIEHDATNHQPAGLVGWNSANIPHWSIPLADLYADWNIETGFFAVKITLDTFGSTNSKTGIAVAVINNDATPAGTAVFAADTNATLVGWGNQTATSRGVRQTSAGNQIEMILMPSSERFVYMFRRYDAGAPDYVFSAAGTVMVAKDVADCSLQISSFQDTGAAAVAHTRVYSIYTAGWQGAPV